MCPRSIKCCVRSSWALKLKWKSRFWPLPREALPPRRPRIPEGLMLLRLRSLLVDMLSVIFVCGFKVLRGISSSWRAGVEAVYIMWCCRNFDVIKYFLAWCGILLAWWCFGGAKKGVKMPLVLGGCFSAFLSRGRLGSHRRWFVLF